MQQQRSTSFYKYQGTGNDFIIPYPAEDLPKEEIQVLCRRKFGIGSDGLMKIWQGDESGLIHIDFYNPDGSVSFCGNGSRCAVQFARDLGWIDDNCHFEAFDGRHYAFIENGVVWIEMFSHGAPETIGGQVYVNTGAPHVAVEVPDTAAVNLSELARPIRWDERFAATGGTNVNVFEVIGPDRIRMRTFEKGVEAETLSCGTGVTACASVYRHLHAPQTESVVVQALGGTLEVRFDQERLYLGGDARRVFQGVWEWE